MRLGLLLACLLFFAPSAVAEPLLTYDEIIRVLPGRWVMHAQPGETSGPKRSCEDNAMRIWLEKDANGNLMYRSQGEEPGAQIFLSPVIMERTLLGRPKSLIRIHYENEKRLTDSGREIEWQLIMTDKNTFYWRATHWPMGAVTSPSTRCPAADLVG